MAIARRKAKKKVTKKRKAAKKKVVRKAAKKRHRSPPRRSRARMPENARDSKRLSSEHNQGGSRHRIDQKTSTDEDSKRFFEFPRP